MEAIPDIVQVIDVDEEKVLRLTKQHRESVLADQVTSLIRMVASSKLTLSNFIPTYIHHFGHTLCIQDYGVTNIRHLMEKIPHVVKLVDYGEGNNKDTVIELIDRTHIPRLINDILLILMTLSGEMKRADLLSQYAKLYPSQPISDPYIFEREMQAYVKVVEDDIIRLLPLQMYLRDLRQLILADKDKQILVSQLESTWTKKYSAAPPKPTQFGYASTLSLLHALKHVIVIKGTGSQMSISLNQDFINLYYEKQDSSLFASTTALSVKTKGAEETSTAPSFTNISNQRGLHNGIPSPSLRDHSKITK